MVLPPPPMPLVVREDDAHSMSTDSSPIALVYAVCRVLKARALLDRSLLAGRAGDKDGKGDGGDDGGNAGGGGQDLDCAPDWDGPPLPPPSSGMTAMRVVGK
jgi:hypothetical protein